MLAVLLPLLRALLLACYRNAPPPSTPRVTQTGRVLRTRYRSLRSLRAHHPYNVYRPLSRLASGTATPFPHSPPRSAYRRAAASRRAGAVNASRPLYPCRRRPPAALLPAARLSVLPRVLVAGPQRTDSRPLATFPWLRGRPGCSAATADPPLVPPAQMSRADSPTNDGAPPIRPPASKTPLDPDPRNSLSHTLRHKTFDALMPSFERRRPGTPPYC